MPPSTTVGSMPARPRTFFSFPLYFVESLYGEIQHRRFACLGNLRLEIFFFFWQNLVYIFSFVALVHGLYIWPLWRGCSTNRWPRKKNPSYFELREDCSSPGELSSISFVFFFQQKIKWLQGTLSGVVGESFQHGNSCIDAIYIQQY